MTFPNVLTSVRAALVIPVIWLIATGDLLAALVVFIGAAATDALDGPLARRRGPTPLGAALDPLADKILIVGSLAALAVRGLAPAWPVGVIIARELVATWVRGRAPQALGASADGKAKTVLQVAATAALLVAASSASASAATTANSLLVAATALTVLSGVRLVLRAQQTTADTA